MKKKKKKKRKKEEEDVNARNKCLKDKLLWILIAFKKFVIASIDKSIPTVVTLIQSNPLTPPPVIKIEIGTGEILSS